MSTTFRRWLIVSGALVLAAATWGGGVEPRLIDEQHITAIVPNLCRGIGFSLIPIRIGCPPELTFITLGSPQGLVESRR